MKKKLKYETRFPRGFPEVGDVIRFTCSGMIEVRGGVTAEQITGRKHYSTVEVFVTSRQYDESTGLFFLTTSNDIYQSICRMVGEEWETTGFILVDDESSEEAKDVGLLRRQEYRAVIHEMKIIRKAT